MGSGSRPNRSLDDVRKEVEKLEAVATGFNVKTIDESLAPRQDPPRRGVAR